MSDWFQEEAYFALHGHFLGTVDIDCSLCGEPPTPGEAP